MSSGDEGNQLLKRINVANKNIKLLLDTSQEVLVKLREMMKTLEEKLETKSIVKNENKDEEKAKIEKIFEKKGLGRPKCTFEDKQKQYIDMLNNGKIKQPKQQTLDYYSIIKEGDKYIIDDMV